MEHLSGTQALTNGGLSESPVLLRAVLDYSPVGMALLDANAQIVRVNTALIGLLGYDMAEVATLKGTDLLPIDGVSASSVQFARMQAGRLDHFQTLWSTKHGTGEPVPTEVTVTALFGKNGKPWQYVLQFVDLSAQRAAEDQLRQMEARWNTALDIAEQGVWDHDIATDTISYSRFWRRMRGFADDQEGEGTRDAWLWRLHFADRDHFLSVAYPQRPGKDGCYELVYRERHEDGHFMWIWSRSKAIEWDGEGRPSRIVGTDTDISYLNAFEAGTAATEDLLEASRQAMSSGVRSAYFKQRIGLLQADPE